MNIFNNPPVPGTQPIKVGMVGDSITYAGQVSGNYNFHSARSIPYWASRRAELAFVAGPNDGTGGRTAKQLYEGSSLNGPITSRVPVVDPSVTHVIVLIGTNDSGQGIAVEVSLDYIVRCWDAILQANKIPIAATIPPRNTADLGIISYITRLNNGIRRLAALYRIPLADIFEECVDYSYGAGMAFRSGFTSDDVHLTNMGVYKGAAVAVAKALGYFPGDLTSSLKWVPPRTSPIDSIGSILPDGLFSSFGGTINESGSDPKASSTSYWGGDVITYNGGATPTVFDSDSGEQSVGAYGGSNIFSVSLPASANFTANGRYTSVIAPEMNIKPGSRIGVTFNYSHRPGIGSPTGNSNYQFSLRDKSSPSDVLIGFQYSQTIGDLALEFQDSNVIDAGRVYLEFIYPQYTHSGIKTQGLMYVFFNSLANGGISSPASFNISNIGIWNLTALHPLL